MSTAVFGEVGSLQARLEALLRSLRCELTATRLVTAEALSLLAFFVDRLTFLPVPMRTPAAPVVPTLLAAVVLVGAMTSALAAERAQRPRLALVLTAAMYAAVAFLGAAGPLAYREFWLAQVMSHCFVLAAVFAGDLVHVGGAPQRTYIVAAVLASLCGALVQSALFNLGPAFFTTLPAASADKDWSPLASAVYVAMQWLLVGGGAMVLYGHRREARSTFARLHAAEIERIARSREVLESRLQVMQARVEPQFLLHTLAKVRELYERDASRAERMLDELVAYLRAAMPQMRHATSTLGQEIELTRAYLTILRLQAQGQLACEIDVPTALHAIEIAPMVLLPLIDHLLTHGAAPRGEGRTLRIAVTRMDTRLQLSIRDSGRAKAQADVAAFDGIRGRLAALYGSNARLAVRSPAANGGVEALVEIPCAVEGPGPVRATAPATQG